MERKYCGLNRAQMNEVLNTMCILEERFEDDISQEEEDAFDIAIQCVTTVLNRMVDDKPISWDDE